MPHESPDLDRLKLKVFELEATLLFAQLRLRVFRDLAIEIWQSQGVKIHPTDDILTVLGRLEKEAADILLADYADVNAPMAGLLRQLAEQYFGELPNTGAEKGTT